MQLWRKGRSSRGAPDTVSVESIGSSDPGPTSLSVAISSNSSRYRATSCYGSPDSRAPVPIETARNIRISIHIQEATAATYVSWPMGGRQKNRHTASRTPPGRYCPTLCPTPATVASTSSRAGSRCRRKSVNCKRYTELMYAFAFSMCCEASGSARGSASLGPLERGRLLGC